MTEDEIIKVLECIRNTIELDEQPLISVQIVTDILDLIELKNAEIDALIAGQETLQKNLPKVVRKEFAEKLKEIIRDMRFLAEAEYQCEYIDDLVKEMGGE